MTANPGKFPLSVLIPALNERRNIVACIESVSWCSDVVVVDSTSTDGTQELSRSCGARVVQFRYEPGGPKKKNWALANVEFQNDWVLILDADERITPALRREIMDVLPSPGDVTGYYINRRFMFMGKWIRHCGYFPSWNLRLLKRGCGAYEMLPDTTNSGDNEVHEHVLLNTGGSANLNEPMDHYAFPTIDIFVEKHNRYSTWEAHVGRAYYARDIFNVNSENAITSNLRFRRLLKRLARRIPCPHWARFFYHYILKKGILDGREGYILCHLLGEYEFLIWAKGLYAPEASSAQGRATRAAEL